MKGFVSIGLASKILGVSIPTLRRWDRLGKLKSAFRTFGCHRRYNLDTLRKIIKPKEDKPQKTICYARVSSHDQKEDLKRQSDRIMLYAKERNLPNPQLITDLGSGMNYKKKGLKKLIALITQQEISHLILNYKDRLLRFGSELVFLLCSLFQVKVIIIEEKELEKEEELVQDVLAIITVFSAKINGSRSHKNKKLTQALNC